LENIVGWFDHWLMSVPKPEYEVAPQEEVPIRRNAVFEKQSAPPG